MRHESTSCAYCPNFTRAHGSLLHGPPRQPKHPSNIASPLEVDNIQFLFLTRSPHCHFVHQFHLFGYYVLSDVSYLFFFYLFFLLFFLLLLLLLLLHQERVNCCGCPQACSLVSSRAFATLLCCYPQGRHSSMSSGAQWSIDLCSYSWLLSFACRWRGSCVLGALRKLPGKVCSRWCPWL